MATRAEKAKSKEQRHGPTPKAIKRAAARKTPVEAHTEHVPKKAGRKASYAREEASDSGTHSRKSTRGSANRSKADTNLTLREQRTKGSAKNRYRKDAAKKIRVRGSTPAKKASR